MDVICDWLVSFCRKLSWVTIFFDHTAFGCYHIIPVDAKNAHCMWTRIWGLLHNSGMDTDTCFKLTVIFQVNLDWTVAPLALILHLFQRKRLQTASTFIFWGPSHHPTSSVTALTQTHCTNLNTTVLRPFFRDHPGEPVPEENFWTLWYGPREDLQRQTHWPSGWAPLSPD